MPQDGGRFIFDNEGEDIGKRISMKVKGLEVGEDLDCYVYYGERSIFITLPYENDPKQLKARLILEDFCTKLSKIMEDSYVQRTKTNAQ